MLNGYMLNDCLSQYTQVSRISNVLLLLAESRFINLHYMQFGLWSGLPPFLLKCHAQSSVAI